MFNTNEWYVFDEGTIDTKTCNKIKDWAEGKWEPTSVDINNNTTEEERRTGRVIDYQPNSEMRISDVAWCSEQWLYDIIWPLMERANEEAGWGYDIRGAEAVQITRYKPGGFYHFHRDGFSDRLAAYQRRDNQFLDGHVRKISMSLMLNDNFEGGAFEFASYAKTVCSVTPIEASAGSVIVFPSYNEHRVAQITKGTRYSVVCWFLGPPFV